jgi:hypothetical protein
MNKNWMSLVGLLVLVFAWSAGAAEFRILTQQEMVRLNATHVWTVGVDDLTTTTDNTAQTVDLAVSAGTGVEFVAYEITESFVTATTTGNQYTTSLTMAIGDSASATRYLAAQQLAKRNVEVPFAWSGTDDVARYLYTAAGTLRLTFTPAGDVSVADFTAGEVRIYMRMILFAVPRSPAVTGD